MSGFLTNAFSAFSKNSATTDRKQTLAGYGDLSNVFNFGMSQAKSGQAAGTDSLKAASGDLATSGDYYSKLLSGNRAATLSAAAPTVNAANAATDAQKTELATSGTGRGGGTNATSQQLDTNKMASVDNAIAGAKADAAKGIAGVGNATAGIGGTQLSNATNLLGLGTSAASDLTKDSIASRPQSQQAHDAKAKQYADMSQQVLDVVFGA